MDTQSNASVGSNVVSVTVDGIVTGETLDEPVQISFQMTDETPNLRRCVYYDFQQLSWLSTGCVMDFSKSSNATAVCSCHHLTNFAVLLDSQGQTENLGSTDKLALGLITTIGLSISVILMGIVVLAFIFIPVCQNVISMPHFCSCSVY